MADALTSLTIAEAADLIRSKQLSPVELTQAHLDRIEKIDPLLNSYITVTSEMALEQARSAEAEIMRGEYRGVLHGIPIALKGLFETEGIRTTAGSKFYADYIPKKDAVVVQKLKSSGAIVLGKTNMHEWAFGVINDNPHYGTCHNPWDLNHSTGGSSGGSGAAVAAHLCMGALGSDTRGSIRIPAALCGIVGLKPTYGRVSLNGVIPLSWSLDHAGPMARTVKDAAILFQAIAGRDESDDLSVNTPVDNCIANISDEIKEWNVGLFYGDFFDYLSKDVRWNIDSVIQDFKSLDIKVRDTGNEYQEEVWEHSRIISSVDAAAFHQWRLKDDPEQSFGSDVLKRLRQGQELSGTDYAWARKSQSSFSHDMQKLFQEFDILILPTTPVSAPNLNNTEELDRARKYLSALTAPFNMAGLPAISIPCGFTSNGLPIGLQLVARPWAEAQLLRAAYAYEQATEWHKHRPPID